MDAVMFNGENECEIAAMLLRQCSDEWVAHALFDAMEFVVGRVYKKVTHSQTQKPTGNFIMST